MSNHTVLLVDDDVDITRATSMRLGAAGYGTLVAHDGTAGVESALQHHPDAILLDVRMPRKDGFGTLTDLKHRQETRDIPVIMLSASVCDQQAALDAGARYFLKKPYRGDVLLRAIDSVIASPGAPAGPHIKINT